MTSDRLRLAAQAMRREQSPFLDAVADFLQDEADRSWGLPTPKADAIAEAYLSDPGDLPAAITGGAQ